MTQQVELPNFLYHRDPVASGSIKFCNTACECCGLSRGAIYDGVIYTTSEVESICPWCIATGAAAEKYDANFIDYDFVDDNYIHLDMSSNYHKIIGGLTIGFSVFNPVSWWVHCDEPAEYITRAEPYDLIFECKKCRLTHIIKDYD
jgi:uncharacterized protein